MRLEVPMHSFIDVITNSSTEIFVRTHSNTVKLAEELIDEILVAARQDFPVEVSRVVPVRVLAVFAELDGEAL